MWMELLVRPSWKSKEEYSHFYILGTIFRSFLYI